jgi:E3 ubiquitin-protein ligase MARCH6
MDDTEKSDEQDGQNLRHRRRRNLHQPGISVVDEVSLGHTDNFEFTFRSPTRFPQETGAFGRRSLSEPPSIAKFSGVFDRGSGPPRVMTPSPVALAFAPVALDRPAEGPSALPKPDIDADADAADEQGGPSDSNPQPSLDSSSQESSWTTASSSFREARMQPAPKDKDKEGRYRRPQLPNTTPTIDDPAVGVVLSPAVPSLSPGLATYRAPEELEPEAGPSRRREYFDRDEVSSGESDYKGKGKADGDGDGNLDTDTDVEMEMEDIGVEDIEAEHARYFADAEDDDEDDMPKLLPPSDSEDEEEEEGSPRNDDDMDGDFDIDEDEGGEDEDGEDGGDFDDAEAPIWQAIQIEDDEVAEVGDGEMDAGAAEHEVAAPAPVPPAGGDGAIDLNDDLDGNVEDDMEGAMEGTCIGLLLLVSLITNPVSAIGMRGPVYGVVQNVCLRAHQWILQCTDYLSFRLH